MKINIKKEHPNAIIPSYAHIGDAGMDLTAVERNIVQDSKNDEYPDYIEYKTGLSFEIPEGYVGLLFPRSSNSKQDLTLCNSVGILDSNYRGEVTFRYKLDNEYDEIIETFPTEIVLRQGKEHIVSNIYNVGNRIGQIIIIPHPQIEFNEVLELSNTSRGIGGYGSTGK